MIRCYRYRLYPTETQKVLLEKHFGCSRWIYNWGLEQKTKTYKETKKGVSAYTLQARLPVMKVDAETEWLSEVSAQSLQFALHSLDTAFTRFFKRTSEYPRFKSRSSHHDSFSSVSHTRVRWDRNRIYLLKFQEGIPCALSRRFDGKIKTSTVSRNPTGKYYISILVETPDPLPKLIEASEATAIGLDFGLKDLVVTSDGKRYLNPRTLKRFQRRLKIRQRRLSRTKKDSKNRDKARVRLALTHERISNIRSNNLHHISSDLTRKNQAVSTICIEDLSVKGMLDSSRGTKSLRRSISDAGWSELRRQLTYKCAWSGKNLRVIGRFEPSSKMCSECGHINSKLRLEDREWTCTDCGTHHDRDINAAINIKQMAFCTQNTESKPSTSHKTITYRKVVRKSTPVDQPTVVELKQEQRHRCNQASNTCT